MDHNQLFAQSLRKRVLLILLSLVFLQGFTGIDARSLYLQGKYAFSKGKTDEAYKLFQKALKESPKNGNPLFYMGYINEKQDKKESAMKHYQNAIKLRMDKDLKEKAYWKLVLHYKNVRDWQNLLSYSQRFLQFADYKSVRSLEDLAKRNYNPIFSRSIKLLQTAQQDRREGNLHKAKKGIEKLLIVNPSYFPAHWEAAIIKMRLRDFSDALVHLQILLKRFPNRWEYNYKSSICYYHTSSYNKALKSLEKAKKYYNGKGSNFSFHYNLLFFLICCEPFRLWSQQLFFHLLATDDYAQLLTEGEERASWVGRWFEGMI